MSEEPDFLKWFRENYPTANTLFAKITENINEVYAKTQLHADSLPIDLFQMRKNDGFSQLGARDSAVVFYSIFAKSIIDIVSQGLQAEITAKFLEQLKSETRNAVKDYVEKNFPIPANFKRCQKCNYDNDFKNKFCGQCGNKL